jgi:hypothetical protein
VKVLDRGVAVGRKHDAVSQDYVAMLGHNRPLPLDSGSHPGRSRVAEFGRSQHDERGDESSVLPDPAR